ncbi:hypothetical protein V2A60_007300 [Cordyceps javanica]
MADDKNLNHDQANANEANGSQANHSQANGGQANSNQENDTTTDGSQEAKMTSSFTSIEVSDGRGEPMTLTEKMMTERTEVRRDLMRNYADQVFVPGSIFRLTDKNPYTNEIPFSTSDEKKA